MCGITGMLALKGQRPDEAIIARMNAQIAHRGPDASGTIINGPCALANTRLAVIDLSDIANQPMRVTHPIKGDGQYDPREAWMVYNGESYNFADVRTVLQAHGHEFFSDSDTETLLRAYLEFGAEKFLHPFRGMFALAIWDVQRVTLTLARDRVGKKPLYYWHDDEWLVFGSEIKTLLEHPAISARLNETVIPHYLTYGYPPAPETLFEGIKVLPPGHLLTADLSSADGPRIKEIAYWTPPFPHSDGSDTRSVSDFADELRTRLTNAIRLRMIADVPLGAFLSGGLDSAAIVALMSELSPRPVKTFSIGFADADSFDETSYAQQVADQFGTDHHTFTVSPDLIDLTEELVWHHDQPFGDSSAIPTYMVSKMAREHVTVALTGDGGDEIFAGYDRFRAARIARSYRRLPTLAHRAISGALDLLPESTEYGGVVRRTGHFVNAAHLPLGERYLSWVRYVPAEWVSSLLSTEAEANVQSHYAGHLADDGGILPRLLDLNFRTYLPDDLLVKADRCSMANSLELRSPFLDHVLIRFAAGLPTSMKLRGSTSKYLLKKAMRGLLTDDIIDRKKHGFGVPVGAWFRGDLADYARDVLTGSQAAQRGIFEMESVQAMLDEHMSGKTDLGQALWPLLTFELWMRRYFD